MGHCQCHFQLQYLWRLSFSEQIQRSVFRVALPRFQMHLSFIFNFGNEYTKNLDACVSLHLLVMVLALSTFLEHRPYVDGDGLQALRPYFFFVCKRKKMIRIIFLGLSKR
jgi:hypothetical protein